MIHRSTLRYRLQRIREISGLDLADVGNRLNLHVATRAWLLLGRVGDRAGQGAPDVEAGGQAQGVQRARDRA